MSGGFGFRLVELRGVGLGRCGVVPRSSGGSASVGWVRVSSGRTSGCGVGVWRCGAPKFGWGTGVGRVTVMDRSVAIDLPDDRPLRVVLVCLGNICRSPMAAAVFRSRLGDAGLDEVVEIGSAGTGGWHVGGPADSRAAATLERHGYDTTHTARQLVAHDLADFDLILVADHANRSDVTDLARTPDQVAKVMMLRSFDPASSNDAEIPDPYYGEGDGFETVLAMIEAAADGFVASVEAARAT